MTLRSAEKPGASEEIWKVRARPMRARRATESAPTSRPRNRMLPASGTSSPAICASSVVLPAPFGPIWAWISCGWTVSETPSVARSAPNDLVRPCTSRSGSVMTRRSRDEADQAAAREQHDAQEDQAQDQLPALGDPADDGLQQDEQGSAGERPEQPADAAQNHEDHDLAGLMPGQHRRTDEAVQLDEQGAGQPCDHRGQHEGHELDRIRRDTHGSEPPLVLAGALQRRTEARADDSGAQEQGQQEEREAHRKELQVVAEIDARQAVVQIERQAVLAAIGRDRDGEIENHLGERER